MKIGIISDTHIPVTCPKLPKGLLDALKGCELILHAGDLLEASVLDELKKIAKVEAVHGNMDPPKLQSSLPDIKTLEVAGKRLCLTHGYGRPDMMISCLKNDLSGQKPDIIVFGHSHVPTNEYAGGILFFNPGSATDTIYAPYRSYGIIEIEKGEIKANIYKLERG